MEETGRILTEEQVDIKATSVSTAVRPLKKDAATSPNEENFSDGEPKPFDTEESLSHLVDEMQRIHEETKSWLPNEKSNRNIKAEKAAGKNLEEALKILNEAANSSRHCVPKALEDRAQHTNKCLEREFEKHEKQSVAGCHRRANEHYTTAIKEIKSSTDLVHEGRPCKMACGRSCAPGIYSPSGKPYSTCCKPCARGQQCHDDACNMRHLPADVIVGDVVVLTVDSTLSKSPGVVYVDESILGGSAGVVYVDNNRVIILGGTGVYEMNTETGKYNVLRPNEKWKLTRGAVYVGKNCIVAFHTLGVYEIDAVSGTHRRLSRASWNYVADTVYVGSDRIIAFHDRGVYEVNAKTGQYKELNKQRWDVTSSGGKVYVGNDRIVAFHDRAMYEVDASTGVHTLLRDKTWPQSDNAAVVYVGGNRILAFHPGGVYEISATTGEYTCISCLKWSREKVSAVVSTASCDWLVAEPKASLESAPTEVNPALTDQRSSFGNACSEPLGGTPRTDEARLDLLELASQSSLVESSYAGYRIIGTHSRHVRVEIDLPGYSEKQMMEEGKKDSRVLVVAETTNASVKITVNPRHIQYSEELNDLGLTDTSLAVTTIMLTGVCGSMDPPPRYQNGSIVLTFPPISS